jgi:hypothetical protein
MNLHKNNPLLQFAPIRVIRGRSFLAVLALAFVTSTISAQDYGTEKPAKAPAISIPLTPEQKTALQAIDARMAGIEALIAKIDDAGYKAASVGAMTDLKRRRVALEKNFETGLYESLMHSVISRYQIIALWLTPARLPGPAAKPGATGENKSQTKTGGRSS